VSRPSYTIELALDARFAKDLAAGGVFVPAHGFEVLDELDLVVRGNAGELCLHARVVYIDPATGCGLELVGFGPEMKERLAQIAVTPEELAVIAGTKLRRKRLLTNSSKRTTRDGVDMIAGDATCETDDDELDEDIDDEHDVDTNGELFDGDARAAGDNADADASGDNADAETGDNGDANTDAGANTGATTDAGDDADSMHDADADANADAGDDTSGDPNADATDDRDDLLLARTKSGRIPLNAQERLRGISLAEQMKIARGPSASERMALERMYGKNVWDALLHNPGLTAPEVARLARLGTLPRVLLEIIVTNNTWLQVPEVRRALLSNPRLGTDQIARVLRLLPKHELKVASTIPAYPQSVRSLAKKMIKDSE
jgi:hypothetical protein